MDEQKIQQKLQQYKINVNSNQNLSDEEKQKILQKLDESYIEANGVFDEFEEIILCLPNEQLEIIINANQASSQAATASLNSSGIMSQQSNEGYNRNQQMSQGSSNLIPPNNSMAPPRGLSQNYQQVPPSYYSQQNMQQKSYGSSQQYSSQQIPKMPSSQQYQNVQVTPEQRKQYTYQLLSSILKRNMSQINKQDPKYALWHQKQNLLYEKYQSLEEIDQQQWSFLDKQKYLQYHLNLFEQNIRLCKDPNRQEHLSNFFNNFKIKISNDPDLFLFFISSDKTLSPNDRKVLFNEDLGCTSEFQILLDYYKISQNQAMEKQIETIQSQKQVKGFDSFLMILKELKIDMLFAILESRGMLIKKFCSAFYTEVVTFFKQLGLDQSTQTERVQQFEINLKKMLNQYQFRENFILKEIKSYFPDQLVVNHLNLINNIINNKELNSISNHLSGMYQQQPDISNFILKRSQIPPRQQSMNSSQGIAAVTRQPDDTLSQSYQKQQQMNQNQAAQYNTPATADSSQFSLSQQQSAGFSQSQPQMQSKPINLSSQQQAQVAQQQAQPQNNQFANPYSNRNPSQQQVKNEEEGKPNIPSQQQSQATQQQFSQSQVQAKSGYGLQSSNFEETQQVTPAQPVKQEYVKQEYQQNLQPAKQMFSQTKTKTKRLLSDDAITKRLEYLCKENNIELPSSSDIEQIIVYLNEVFKIYMKNLIERLLQSSIVENIDNEFRLFCSDKLEAHLVPFRGQSIDKYLLNKQDYTGARDMTFLKYYIVQSENKNIRRTQLDRNDEELEQACYDSICKNSLFDKSSMKYNLDKTQRKGCAASEEIKNNISKVPPQKSKNAKKDLKLESMPQAISLATTNCQRQKITLKNIQLFLEADPIYRKSAILLKTYLQ